MIIKQLEYNDCKGKKYKAKILSNEYLTIEPEGDSFDIKWIKVKEPLVKELEDDMLSEWLDNPVAYGAFDSNGKLIGFVEGFLEEWNNRYAYSNHDPENHDMRIEMGRKL